MSISCMACLQPLTGDADYHPRCVRELFGTSRLPRIDCTVAKMHTFALAMAGHISLSGVQRKISMGLSTDRMTLQVDLHSTRYILKPQAGSYPHLPENEHVSMRLAKLFKIAIPPCALVCLEDDSFAYVVKRFDRTPKGKKVQEDFCQLAEKYPREKYDGSAELCARLVQRYAAEPGIEILKLFRMLFFAWWIGNGDLHLKNLSLGLDDAGRVCLTPAYDCLNTRLAISDDTLAMPVGGKKDNLKRSAWLAFAEYCALPARAAERVLTDATSSLPAARALIHACSLPHDLKVSYMALITERAARVAASP